MSAAWDGLGIGEVWTSLKLGGSGMRRFEGYLLFNTSALFQIKNLNFAECWYECLDLLPIYIWMFYNWSAPKTCGWLLKILWDWEEFEVAWIIIKGLLARSWDVTTDFFTTQFSVFEGGWPKRITISLLLTKPIFILLSNEIVSHVLQHDTKSWMNWSMWVWKRRMTDSKQIDFNVRLWRHQGWQSRWRPRPLYWAVHIHRGAFIGKTSLLPSSRWENFNISCVYFVEFEVLGVAHICLSRRWINNWRNQELTSSVIQLDFVVNVLSVLKLWG